MRELLCIELIPFKTRISQILTIWPIAPSRTSLAITTKNASEPISSVMEDHQSATMVATKHNCGAVS